MGAAGGGDDVLGQDPGVVRAQDPVAGVGEGDVQQGLVTHPLPGLEVCTPGPDGFADHPHLAGAAPVVRGAVIVVLAQGVDELDLARRVAEGVAQQADVGGGDHGEDRIARLQAVAYVSQRAVQELLV